MKKNRMMRLASGLLVAVLLTTSVISGTFAKYTTSASSQDSARVAKWGVIIGTTGTGFSDVYKVKSGIGYSVDSVNGDLVVAPGTEYTDNALFTISGSPEVAVDVDAVLADGYQDVFLKAGTYTDFTKVIGYGANDVPLYGTFTFEKDYYPVQYTLTQIAEGVTPVTSVTGNLEDIRKALEEYTASAQYAPNTNLNTVFTLSWEWEFEGEKTLKIDNADVTFDEETVDAADTWLGNAKAGIMYDTVDADAYSTDIKFDITVTATQID